MSKLTGRRHSLVPRSSVRSWTNQAKRLAFAASNGALMPNANWRLERRGILTLGCDSYSNSFSMVWAARDIDRVIIGERTSISYHVAIVFPGDHDLDAPSAHPSFDDRAQGPLTVQIGDDVLIGFGSIILAPCEIGDGSVVGAGAVVAKNVPPGVVVAGQAASPVRVRAKNG